MAKGFRLSKGFLKEMRRLSKEAKGKRSVGSNMVDPPRGNRRSSSMSMEWIRDLCYDDYDESDLEHWGLHSRIFRAKAAAADQLRDLFDPNYGPWEEVHEDSDSMDLEDQGAMDEYCAGFSWNDHGVVDLPLGTPKRVDCESQDVSSSKVGPKDRYGAATATYAVSGNPSSTVELGSTAESVKVEEVDKGLQSYVQEKRPRFPVNRHRKKKVIMGRDFLLVSRDCFRESKLGRRFQFFHKPSLSTVVVKVQEHTLMDPSPFDTPVTRQEHTPIVQVVDELMVSGAAAQSPLQMEDDSISPVSCVSTVSTPDSHHSDSEEVSSGGVREDLQDTAASFRNLRSKRVLALWRYRLEDYGPISVMQLGNRQKKKVGRVKVGRSHSKVLNTPIGVKRKRERVIEDSYGDPHTFRCPQRRALR